MKYIIASLLALALFASVGVASAGNPSLCAKDGWVSAQSDSGAPFASMKECAKARSVFQPSVTITPDHVGPWSSFSVRSAGFHANAAATVSFDFAAVGAPPSVYNVTLDANGEHLRSWSFMDCWAQGPLVVPVIVRDSFGVHASAQVTLC